jgi:hypothetical protein
MQKNNLTVERLKEILIYDQDTGEFSWRTRRGSRAPQGGVAGAVSQSSDKLSYVQIQIDGRLYKAHRLAWLYVHGVWPEEMVDHINGDGLNNTIANLRLANRSENMRNTGVRRDNIVGRKGVTWHRRLKKWRADITINGKQIYLGSFNTTDLAHAAYCSAAARLHGDFARVA